LGELGGDVPYTAYNARSSYIKNNPDVIEGFSRAINRALKYVEKHEASEIADAIIDYFPDTSQNNLTTIINRYKDGDAWRDNTSINEDEWKHIQEIVIEAGELDSYVPFEDLIYTKYMG
jgi:NitT/TauT family transport system substrate-binding protein